MVVATGTKKMEYKGKQWHENCFTCNNCKKALGTQSFIPKDDQNYCVTCYEELFATKCTKCKKVRDHLGNYQLLLLVVLLVRLVSVTLRTIP